LVVFLFFFRHWLLEPFLGGIPFFPYMLMGLVAVALSPSYVLFQSNLQSKQLGRRYGLNNLCFFLVNMGLTVLFLIVFRMKAESILLALALTNGIFFVYTWFDFPRRIHMRFRPEHLRKSFAYSLPLIPHSLAGWAMGLVDRLFLNHFRTAAEVGVYSIAWQIGNLINILTAAVNQAFVPWFFEKCEQGEQGRRRVARISEVVVLGYAICALVVSYFTPEVLGVMVSPDFREGWKITPFLAFSFVFGGIYYFFVNPLFIRRTSLVPLVTLTSAAVGLILNWYLVPRWGMVGASVASLLSMATSSLVALWLSNRVEYIGYNWVRIYTYALVPFLLSMLVYFQGRLSPVTFFAIKAGICGVAATSLIFLFPAEARGVRQYLLAKLKAG
jgi:O-antigen/teichoic acid export membrane protein